MAQGNQIASINACAAYFAQANYHVRTSFYSDNGGCECVVFFKEKQKKESIIKSMRCFADVADKIEFKELQDEERTFYTICLTKGAQL